jgi:hypothetical protein
MSDHSDIIHMELAVLDKFIPEDQTLLWEATKTSVVARIDYLLLLERYQHIKEKIVHVKRLNTELRDEILGPDHTRDRLAPTGDQATVKKNRSRTDDLVLR